jgi:hypothetical protein
MTLQLKRPTRHFSWMLLWIGLLGLILFVFLEALAQAESFQANTPLPSYGSSYRQLERQLNLIHQFAEEENSIPCLILGDSTVLSGIDPEVFQAAYQDHSGETITCYTFGLGGMTAINQADIAEILVEKFHPQLMIVGVNARGFTKAPDFSLSDSAWGRYRLGDWNLEGWLLDHSALYRAVSGYLRWEFPQDTAIQVSKTEGDRYFELVRRDGFIPLPVEDSNASGWNDDLLAWDREQKLWSSYPWYFVGEQTNPAQKEAWERLLQLRDETRLIVVEMPIQLEYLYENGIDQGAFMADILAAGCAAEVPVWHTMGETPFLGETAWYDDLHVNLDGSALFSSWLGEQIGGAEPSGACNTAPPMPENLGLTPEQYEAYLALQQSEAWQGQVVFNPAKAEPYRLSEQTANGLLLNRDNSLSESSILELLAALGQMHYEAELGLNAEDQEILTTWRSNPLPKYLQQLGIDYLLCNDLWLSWLTTEAAAILNDPAQYEKVSTWTNLNGAYDYTLYHPR